MCKLEAELKWMAELKSKTDTVNQNDLWQFKYLGKFALSDLFQNKCMTYL